MAITSHNEIKITFVVQEDFASPEKAKLKDAHPELFKLYQQSVLDDDARQYVFNIDSINGIKVCVDIFEDKQIGSAGFYCFRIYKDFWGADDLFKHYIHNFEDFVHLINEVLPTLTFNKLRGVFESPHSKDGKYNSTVQPQDFTSFLRIPNMKTKNQECCSCMEETKSKTRCGHSICVECESKLSKSSCPMCRKCLCCTESEDECECDDE